MATRWPLTGWLRTNTGWSEASPVLQAANVPTRPERSETKTPPSVAAHTWRRGGAFPARTIRCTSPCTLLPMAPAAVAPSPPGSGAADETPTVACSTKGGLATPDAATSKQYRLAPQSPSAGPYENELPPKYTRWTAPTVST